MDRIDPERRQILRRIDPDIPYLMSQLDLDNYPGWKVVQLRGPRTMAKIFADPLLQITGYIILSLCMLVGLSAGFSLLAGQ